MGNKQSPRTTAEKALDIFKEGNRKFVGGQPRHTRQREASSKNIACTRGSIATILSFATSRTCNLSKDLTEKICRKIEEFRPTISEMVQKRTVRAIEVF